MSEMILWECGSQFDLADLDGALYVPGAEALRPRFARLAAAARERSVPRLVTVVTHRDGDPDITTAKPDYKAMYPVHCIEGTPGWQQIPEAACQRPVSIPREPHADRPIRESLGASQGEILLEVAGFDPWANPAMATVLEVLAPARVAVYGVPGDKLVAQAVEGLLARGIEVLLVEDVIKPFDVKAYDALRTAWAEKGVKTVEHRALFNQ